MNRDQWQQHGVATASAILAILALAGLPATAGAVGPIADSAQVAVYAGGVDFLPYDAYRKAVLTVSGNGATHRYQFDSYQKVTIGLFDPAGELLTDGRYNWELQLVPTEAQAKRLRAEAEDNDGVSPQALAPQSGWFAIRNGAIADPALGEAQRTRAVDPTAGPSPFATASGLDARRPPAQDEDGVVGFGDGVEAEVNAAARRQTPAAADGAPVRPDRSAAKDTDATTTGLGRSLEAAAATDNQIDEQSLGAQAPRPRSDGSNGRPRSDR